jgi:NNP family nitrate/nitrite transporter-like MFS transporter
VVLPAAFAAIAMITPPSARNLAVAFSVPVGYIIGGGAIPTFIGIMGDAGSFATGFVVTGLLIAAGGLLSIRLRLPHQMQGNEPTVVLCRLWLFYKIPHAQFK